MFFRTWSRSWEFSELSYSTLLDHKHLTVFTVISIVAALLVLMGLLVPVIAIGIIFCIYVALTVAILIGLLAVLTSATADAIFKAYLYSFATGKALPENLYTNGIRDAFSGHL